MTRDALIAHRAVSSSSSLRHQSASLCLVLPLSWGILVIPEQLFAVPKKQINHQTSLLGTIEEGGADGAHSCLPSQQLGCSQDWHSLYGSIHLVGFQRLDRQFLALSIGMQALSLASALLPCSTVVPFLHTSLFVSIHLLSCGSSPSALT